VHRRFASVTEWPPSPVFARALAGPMKLALVAALPVAAACNALPERVPTELDCNPYPDIEVSDAKVFAFDQLGEADWYDFTDNTPSGVAMFGVKDLSGQPHGERCGNRQALVIDSYGYNDWGAGFTTWTLRESAPVATGWEGISFWARTIDESDRSFTLVLQDRFGSDEARIDNPATDPPTPTRTCRPLTSEASCTLANIANNPSFEDSDPRRPDFPGWSGPADATLAVSTETVQAGLQSLVVTGLGLGPVTLDLNAAAGGVGSSPINGQSYDFSCWVTLDGVDSANMRLTLTRDCGDGSQRSTISEVAQVSAGTWRKLKGSYTVPADCTMKTMLLSVEGSKPAHGSGTVRVLVDNVSLSRPCCSNGTDDDGNNRTDGEDTACVDKTETNCDDGIDNDGDGGTDCEDLDCCGHAAGCPCPDPDDPDDPSARCAQELFCEPNMDVYRPKADGGVYLQSIPKAHKEGFTASVQSMEGQVVLGGTILDEYDCGHEFNYVVSTTQEWQLYLVPFDDLRQVRSANWNPAGFDRSGLWAFVIRTPREAQMQLWLDDVAFYRHRRE
jgi:hypothetical protein